MKRSPREGSRTIDLWLDCRQALSNAKAGPGRPPGRSTSSWQSRPPPAPRRALSQKIAHFFARQCPRHTATQGPTPRILHPGAHDAHHDQAKSSRGEVTHATAPALLLFADGLADAVQRTRVADRHASLAGRLAARVGHHHGDGTLDF